MGVDYFVERGCPVQRSLTAEGFLAAMVRRRQSQIFTAGQLVIEGEPASFRLPAGGLPVHTLRDGKIIETTVSSADADELAPWAKHCVDCPARATGEAFSCYGFVAYPIRAATERWLVARALDVGLGALLAMNVLDQLDITGEVAAGLRARGRTFFESATPQVAVWGLSDGKEIQLTSDLILELAVFRLPGNFHPLLPLAAALLGLVPTEEITADALVSWMKFPKTLVPKLVAPEVGERTEEHGLVDYLRHIVVAARANLDLVVDG